jgi:serine/threonine protein kinase, bacterial
MPLAAGELFAGYTVVCQLGAGGMGEVYLVEHPRLPRRDALKVLPAELTADREYHERFLREADLVANLWHPHIVAVHDRGEYRGQLWLSMDYVEGTDAGRLLQERHGTGLPPREVVRIVSDVADALDYAHERRLLHRDVKPSNILLSNAEAGRQRIVLADFGIARMVDESDGLTATDMTVGTVAYAAPEQLLGEMIDGRADQYALAATAFHLLTGQQLFAHTKPAPHRTTA